MALEEQSRNNKLPSVTCAEWISFSGMNIILKPTTKKQFTAKTGLKVETLDLAPMNELCIGAKYNAQGIFYHTAADKTWLAL